MEVLFKLFTTNGQMANNDSDWDDGPMVKALPMRQRARVCISR